MAKLAQRGLPVPTKWPLLVKKRTIFASAKSRFPVRLTLQSLNGSLGLCRRISSARVLRFQGFVISDGGCYAYYATRPSALVIQLAQA
jgi:hypothetical protein